MATDNEMVLEASATRMLGNSHSGAGEAMLWPRRRDPVVAANETAAAERDREEAARKDPADIHRGAREITDCGTAWSGFDTNEGMGQACQGMRNSNAPKSFTVGAGEEEPGVRETRRERIIWKSG